MTDLRFFGNHTPAGWSPQKVVKSKGNPTQNGRNIQWNGKWNGISLSEAAFPSFWVRPRLTLQEAIGRWNPDSEWRLQDIDKQWLVHSAWGYSIAESVIQWFQHCRWPCNNEGPSGKAMGISWTEICLAISLSHGGWMPGRRGKGKEERLVHFRNPAEAIAHCSNLAEQTINTWKIVTHIQSLTPQRLWPSTVRQGKVSSLFLLGNPIFYNGFFVETSFCTTRVGC